MLTKHRQKWNRYKKRRDKQARKELICEFLPLVHYVYGRMSLYLPSVLDDHDLLAAGTIGLISAVNDFDIGRGIEFTTFAVPRIRGAILDELREHDWVPRTARRRAAALGAALEKTRRDASSAPDLARAAQMLGMARADLAKLMCRVPPASFLPLEHSSEAEDDANLNVSQLIPDEHSSNPFAEVERADQLKALKRILETLPEVERSVLVQYYFDQRMQKDIARDLRVSRSRISQIHNHAISILKERMEAIGAA